MNVKELGQRIKAKHPGTYDDLSDEELGRRIRAKYPEYADVTDVTRAEKQVSTVDTLIDYYHPSRGRFSSWWQRKKSESRVKLLTVLNEEQRLVIEQGAQLERAVLDGRKREIEFRTFVARNAAQLVEIRSKAELMEQALERGYTLENDQQLKVATELLNLRLVETEQLSRLKIQEHKELKAVDLDNKLTEMREQVRLALIAKHLSEVNKVSIVQESIDGIHKQIDQIESDASISDRAKQRMIEDREEIISTLKESRRGIQRLLEAHNGGDVRADDEDTNI